MTSLLDPSWGSLRVKLMPSGEEINVPNFSVCICWKFLVPEKRLHSTRCNLSHLRRSGSWFYSAKQGLVAGWKLGLSRSNNPATTMPSQSLNGWLLSCFAEAMTTEIKVWVELIHSRLPTKSVSLVQRAVQVHTNQEKMEDDDLNGRSYSGLQRYENNYAPIKHRKRCKKTSLKFSPSRWVQTRDPSVSTARRDILRFLFDREILVPSQRCTGWCNPQLRGFIPHNPNYTDGNARGWTDSDFPADMIQFKQYVSGSCSSPTCLR